MMKLKISESTVEIFDKREDNIEFILSNGERFTGNITHNDGILNITTTNSRQEADTWNIVLKWRSIGQATILSGLMIGLDENLHPFSRRILL
jgi:hypothetical protein